MLIVSERAREHLSAVLADWKCERNVAIRFVRSGKIALDVSSPTDTIIHHRGRQVLLLDAKTAELLQGSRVDVEERSGRQRLRVTRTVNREDV
jgi:hypothetical protein